MQHRRLQMTCHNLYRYQHWHILNFEHQYVDLLIQFTKQKPAMFMTHSITTKRPRQLDLAESACQTGAVDVLRPFPMPATILPTIICGNEYDVVFNVAPMAMMLVPMRIAFLRPQRSPHTAASMAPKKQPMQ